MIQNNTIVDTEETTIGIRSLAFDQGKFLINGEEMFLRGVNRHQEYPYVGYALSNEAQYRDAYKIKSADLIMFAYHIIHIRLHLWMHVTKLD